MVKRVATTLVAVALGATTLAAAPAYADGQPAQASPTGKTDFRGDKKNSGDRHRSDRHKYVADPRILSIDVSPDPVVIKRHGSVKVTATVRAKDAKITSIEVRGPGGGRHGHGAWYGGHPHLGTYGTVHHGKAQYDSASRSWTFSWGHKAGQWQVRVEAIGVNGKKISASRGFSVRHDRSRLRPPKGPRATRIVGFDATPEPVRKGGKLTLKGKLQVARCYGDWFYRSWDSRVSVLGGGSKCYANRGYWHDWYWLGYQDIGVYFQAKGSHKWKYVGTIETKRDGSFSTKVRALKSGTWAVKFGGNSRLKGSGASDYVKVVR